jgi:1,2-diacylglycerol 3-alpha-glucosyltransferase
MPVYGRRRMLTPIKDKNVNILMMTNTYKPLVGGLEKSVESFAQEFRGLGHRVVIVAPEYGGMQPEEDLVRIPAVQNFNGSDFSVQLPIPGALIEALGNFRPDVVHSHHPFFIGDTALRVASKYNVPLVFTHHTLYEENVHYVPGNEEALKRFVIQLSTGYANLADQVFAPSESVMRMMRGRGVETPVEVVPTGIYVENFEPDAGKLFREKFNIPADAFVLGHLGRLAPEKNLEFLTRAVVEFLKKRPDAHFLAVGRGPSEETIAQILADHGMRHRLHMPGVAKGDDLINAYHAMDVFVFASQSETQGLVLTEAMAAGIPVVGVDAPGVREVVHDGINGCLLAHEDIEDFVHALEWIGRQPPEKLQEIKKQCHDTAVSFSMKNSVRKALDIYISLAIEGFVRRSSEESSWARAGRLIHTQWGLIKNLTKATGAMVMGGSDKQKDHTWKEIHPSVSPHPYGTGNDL